MLPTRAVLLSAVMALAATAAAGREPVPKTGPPEDPAKFPAVDSPRWKKRDNGLKVWDVKEGTGPEVKPGATVTVHYTGWTTDGKEFDSSRPRGQPATFALGHLIKGWQDGLPGMKVGGVRRVYVPFPLGYGERGVPPKIPPKADLVFVVEVIEAK